jgi:nitrite reductase/ring-hydroxylating ferredoxin subunit
MMTWAAFFGSFSSGEVVLALVVLISAVCWARSQGQSHPPTADYEHGTFKRKNLDRIRVKSGQFPKPYPTGWYRVCNSVDVSRGQVISISCCGREMVAFRGQDGRAGVLHAFCPHLGTHLGHGGTVEGNNIVCPYHSWAFDADGANKCIPYCSKDMAGSKRVNARKYEIRERLGLIFVWYDPSEKEPWYELTVLDEIENKNEFRPITTANFADWNMHIMEPSQNSADWYHFRTVHQWMCQHDNELIKFMHLDHLIEAKYGTDSKNAPMESTLLLIDEKIVKMKIFGFLPMPKFMCEIANVQVRVQGPQTIIFCVDNWLLGKFRGVFTLTPEEPFLQKSVVRGFASHRFPWVLARILLYLIMQTANQDRKVWEHKSHVSPRNLVVGDGPFAAYGKWLNQFYCEKSEGYDDSRVDW